MWKLSNISAQPTSPVRRTPWNKDISISLVTEFVLNNFIRYFVMSFLRKGLILHELTMNFMSSDTNTICYHGDSLIEDQQELWDVLYIIPSIQE